MWSTRGELAVLATQVDPRLRERMADVTGDLEQLSARVDACTSLCQSVKGDLGALKKAASKPAIGEDDLDFIVSAVSERLLKRSQVKAVPG
jgi:prefoldin subunit 5